MEKFSKVVLTGFAALLLSRCGNGPSSSTSSPSPSVTPHVFDGPCDEMATPFGAGDGTASSPYLLCSALHLNNLSNSSYANSHFLLYDNIDMQNYPINQVPAFGGVFDGNQKAILNLGGTAPLFIQVSGTVKNLGVTGANVTGSYRVGVIVGTITSSGVIENCSVSGTMNASYMVGGIAGFNEGTVNACTSNITINGTDHLGGLVATNTGTISNSISSGTVYLSQAENGAQNGLSGGLVGWNVGGTISHSSSSVNATGQDGVGGLVGEDSQGTISDSYATGSATGEAGVGGFVGISFSSAISNCYATGMVHASSDAGGFIGDNGSTLINVFSTGAVASGGANTGGLAGADSYSYQPPQGGSPIPYNGTITGGYWDTQSSGQSSSAAGTGQTTQNMQLAGTYTGWDFSTIWNSPQSSYPTLR